MQKVVLTPERELCHDILFDINTILPNVLGDELLEVGDERRVEIEMRQRKKARVPEPDLELLRRKFTIALDKPLIKTLHYRAFDKNLNMIDSVPRFELFRMLTGLQGDIGETRKTTIPPNIRRFSIYWLSMLVKNIGFNHLKVVLL